MVKAIIAGFDSPLLFYRGGVVTMTKSDKEEGKALLKFLALTLGATTFLVLLSLIRNPVNFEE